MLEKLGNVLRKTTDKIANAVFLDKNLVEGIVKDLQRALIEADVNVQLVLQLTQKIKKEALDERIKGIEKKEHIIKLLHDELLKIIGKKKELVLGKKETFLLVGLYGSGKTTSAGKIASYYGKRGRKVCCVGLDVHRPAAPEQLKQICDKLNVRCFVDLKEKNALKIWKKYEKEIKEYDLVDELIKEIKEVAKEINATESFLVISADIGQAAKKQAQAFKEFAKVSGVIITKMDSTAKAGGALTACAEVDVGVAFIGTGEKVSDLETFDPEAFLSRLLGMGDLKSLMEKIHSVMAVKEKIGEGALETQEAKVKKWKHIINSMTPEEIEAPELFDKQTSRIQRVAHGSGTTTTDVRMLLKQYKMLNEMIKSQNILQEGKLDQKTMMKLARKFGKKMLF